jgi:hypothetical protein
MPMIVEDVRVSIPTREEVFLNLLRGLENFCRFIA